MSETSEASRIEEDSGEADFHKLDYPPLASDFLRGVREIALFTDGKCDKTTMRSTYYLTGTGTTRFPTFKRGGMTCAFKSSIRASFWMQQKKHAWGEPMEEELVQLHILLSGILTLLSELGGHIEAPGDAAHLNAFLSEATKTISRMIEMDKPDEAGVEAPCAEQFLR